MGWKTRRDLGAARSVHGPFRADQLGESDRYELSQGHPIYCAPSGGRGAQASVLGGEVLDTDPLVEESGFDAGYSPEPGMLRAPDVAIGNVPGRPGWVPGVPPLALEFADTGQNEAELQQKIDELLARGTRFVWVVRLVGPRRVEVYEAGQQMRVVDDAGELTAPGILANTVPVAALFDRRLAHEVAFRNLLQRYGYESLDEVRAEGEAKGRAEGEAKGRAEGEAKGEAKGHAEILLRQLAAKFGTLGQATRARVETADRETLERWSVLVLSAASLDEALAD